jgi:hypothetical protein
VTTSNLNPLSNDFLETNVVKLVEDIGKALILNPVAAALAVLSFIPSLISHLHFGALDPARELK